MSNTPPNMTTDNHWHLDKRVNVPMIVVLVGQIIGFGYLYGSLENRVSNIEERQSEQAAAFRKVPERLAGIEVALIAIKERLDRIR